MDYKDFIKEGEKVIHIPEVMGSDLWWYDPEVVTIGKYRPYFTDGRPDPSPDEYDETCQVEIEEATSWGEAQLSLESLRPIIKEEREVLYNLNVCKLIGYDEDKEYAVVDVDGNLEVCESSDIEEIRNIEELSYEELKKLREQICLGSIYLSDYYNNLGVPVEEVSGCAEEYEMALSEQFGLEWQDYDTPTQFAEYFSI